MGAIAEAAKAGRLPREEHDTWRALGGGDPELFHFQGAAAGAGAGAAAGAAPSRIMPLKTVDAGCLKVHVLLEPPI